MKNLREKNDSVRECQFGRGGVVRKLKERRRKMRITGLERRPFGPKQKGEIPMSIFRQAVLRLTEGRQGNHRPLAAPRSDIAH